MIKTICYTSLYAEHISAFNLEMLFHKTRLFNNKHNIKGVLVAKNNRFFQILEGPETILDNLYLSIKKDSRHHQINEVLNTHITSYSFENFGTGYNTIKRVESLFGLQSYLNSPTINNIDNASLFLTTTENFFK
ncbi:BLUF domain-containing protein [Mariniflexile gromovii]|uniref:BLUF domain-containing protein n=1 Tax=Mariniflexile gromovii TaxID=362523 RepID=A0ABS4BXY2_9FLAO|nr:BLUF domain-containing protein [Mariniflexile gromovii]MBP0905447.1 BLUF domain-containing protein [Mariniflexile gromovii]